jgi:hypothetical protein
MKSNFQLNTILYDKFGKNSNKKRKENESIELTRQNHDPGYEMMITQ